MLGPRRGPPNRLPEPQPSMSRIRPCISFVNGGTQCCRLALCPLLQQNELRYWAEHAALCPTAAPTAPHFPHGEAQGFTHQQHSHAVPTHNPDLPACQFFPGPFFYGVNFGRRQRRCLCFPELFGWGNCRTCMGLWGMSSIITLANTGAQGTVALAPCRSHSSLSLRPHAAALGIGDTG